MEEFDAALTAARAELARLRRDRQQLDMKIAKMEQLVGALNTVRDEGDAVEMTGITDAIRAVMRASWYPLEPTEVRDQLLESGFQSAEKYGDSLLPSVHVVLKRLVKSNEVLLIDNPYDNTKKYWWMMNGAPQFKLGTLAELMKLGAPEGPIEVEDSGLRKALMEQLGSTDKPPSVGEALAGRPRKRQLSDLLKDKK